MSTHRIILGDFVLMGNVKDDGTLSQKIAELLLNGLKDFGVNEVDVDFELSSDNIEDKSWLRRLEQPKN